MNTKRPVLFYHKFVKTAYTITLYSCAERFFSVKIYLQAFELVTNRTMAISTRLADKHFR